MATPVGRKSMENSFEFAQRTESRMRPFSHVLSRNMPCVPDTRSARATYLLLDVISGVFGADCSWNPKRPAQAVRTGGRAGECFPALVDLEREIRVHEDVAVAIFRARFFHS